MIRKLMDIGEVYFITAVAPGFMGVRASQIMEAFPDFPTENIILGNAKNLVQFDIFMRVPYTMCLRHRPHIPCSCESRGIQK